MNYLCIVRNVNELWPLFFGFTNPTTMQPFDVPFAPYKYMGLAE